MNLVKYRGLVVGRVILTALAYLLTFSLASIVGAQEYGEIALYIYLVKNIPLFTMGVTQGLIYNEFSGSGSGSSRGVRSYTAFYSILCVVILTCYGLYYDISVVFVSIPLCLIHILEPYLKTRGDFLAILYVELICVSAFFFVSVLLKTTESATAVFLLFITSGFLTLLFLISRRRIIFGFLESIKRLSWDHKHIKEMILRGFSSYAFNFAYFSFLLVDRTFINQYYAENELGAVMLAFQLAVVAGFIPVAINSRAIVDYGEDRKNGKIASFPELLRRFFLIIFLNIFFLLLGVIGFSAVKDIFFENYHGVFEYMIIYGVALILFNGYGGVSPVLFYMKKQRVPAFIMLTSFIMMSFFNYFSREMDYDLMIVELINFSFLTIGVVLCVIYLFFVVSKVADSSPRCISPDQVE